MDDYEYSWDIDPDDKMIIVIKHHSKELFKISMCDAIESSSRKRILRHVEVCDKTPWLKSWHEEAGDDIVAVLKGVPR